MVLIYGGWVLPASVSGLLDPLSLVALWEWRGVSTLSQLLFAEGGVETASPPYHSVSPGIHCLYPVLICEPVAAVMPPGWAGEPLLGHLSSFPGYCPQKSPPGSPFFPESWLLPHLFRPQSHRELRGCLGAYDMCRKRL